MSYKLTKYKILIEELFEHKYLNTNVLIIWLTLF